MRTPGVFYAAERIETSIAEVAFWRLLFFIESPGLPWPANPLQFTGFAVLYDAELCVDPTQPPYESDPERWTHPTDYSNCQELADEARGLGATAIRSRSARHPDGGVNISLLACSAFCEARLRRRTSWHLKMSEAGVYARCEAPAKTMIYLGARNLRPRSARCSIPLAAGLADALAAAPAGTRVGPANQLVPAKDSFPSQAVVVSLDEEVCCDAPRDVTIFYNSRRPENER